MSDSTLSSLNYQRRNNGSLAIMLSNLPPLSKFPHSIMTPVTTDVYGDEPNDVSFPTIPTESKQHSGWKRSQYDMSTPVNNTSSSAGSKAKKSADSIELRRERNRLHQARHKKKQQQLVIDLENSIYQLKEDIQELKLQRQLIYVGVPTSTNIWGVAAEFFRLFRKSVEPPTIATTVASSDYMRQQSFLRATMTDNVTDGRVCGVDALLETWAIQSACYQEIDMQPLRMENGPGDSMVATTKGILTITENTLRFAFPHLVAGGKTRSDLATKMLGQQLQLHGSVKLEWDPTRGRVASIVCNVDILTPLLRLLGSLDDVSYVFDEARLNPEGRLVST
ncbi:hypothetical protein PHMEG_00021327 [Phytophthora megakarya]|uniref:BZIP domain-containing protein n=1 Tax=Phytophthora megakarya TaxID=4795 RepID=A0A225VLH5_9STRA|nr:hypothetical protein PHMEG_00021327 [Phytophthora megakarya]